MPKILGIVMHFMECGAYVRPWQRERRVAIAHLFTAKPQKRQTERATSHASRVCHIMWSTRLVCGGNKAS